MPECHITGVFGSSMLNWRGGTRTTTRSFMTPQGRSFLPRGMCSWFSFPTGPFRYLLTLVTLKASVTCFWLTPFSPWLRINSYTCRKVESSTVLLYFSVGTAEERTHLTFLDISSTDCPWFPLVRCSFGQDLDCFLFVFFFLWKKPLRLLGSGEERTALLVP